MKSLMHRAFLNRFFNGRLFVVEVMKACFSVRREWSWATLSQTMLSVAVSLGAPKGSLSSMDHVVNALIQAGDISAAQIEFNDGTKGLRLSPAEHWRFKSMRSLRAAVSMTLERDAIRAEWDKLFWKLHGDHEAGHLSAEDLLAQIGPGRRKKDRRLKAATRRFRLLPEEVG